MAQAAVKTKGCHDQVVFYRLLLRLGYKQALWAVVHRMGRLVWKILHEGVRYVERGVARDPKAQKKRERRMVKQMRELGYTVFKPSTPETAEA